MTFGYFLNNCDIAGNLRISVWDDDLKTYIMEECDYDKLDNVDIISLYPLRVARIYPFKHDSCVAVTVELLAH